MKNMNYDHIPQDKFQFVQLDARLHDTKLETKARGYFADALLRFRKNKSSVIAAWILLSLLLFAFLSPIVSPYTMENKDTIYINTPAFVPSIAKMNIGILDGAMTLTSQNETSMNYWRGIAEETGMDPLLKIISSKTEQVKVRGKMVDRVTYTIEVNRYYQPGVVYRTFSVEAFNKLQDWQLETGIQVIYPYVEPKDICDINDNPNIWYEVDSKGSALLDGNGNLVPVYSTRSEIEGTPYYSQRVEGDPGNYIYSVAKSGSVQARICYYNFYQYRNGMEPSYVFGTDALGRDLFAAIGKGARFSILFAVMVSAINLTIGAFYGAVQGYYGGWIDMVLDRISDILSGIPFVVVTTLFQLHLAQKVGVVPSFLFAFVLTGWIGMAGTVRMQFYRYKGQEYVLASRVLGASDWRIMFRHIFPNSLGTIITSSVLVIPGVIFSESSLTYLGIVNLDSSTMTSVGTMLANGRQYLQSDPHIILFPALFISLLEISFNLFGNGLRDAFNPSLRGADE